MLVRKAVRALELANRARICGAFSSSATVGRTGSPCPCSTDVTAASPVPVMVVVVVAPVTLYQNGDASLHRSELAAIDCSAASMYGAGRIQPATMRRGALSADAELPGSMNAIPVRTAASGT